MSNATQCHNYLGKCDLHGDEREPVCLYTALLTSAFGAGGAVTVPTGIVPPAGLSFADMPPGGPYTARCRLSWHDRMAHGTHARGKKMSNRTTTAIMPRVLSDSQRRHPASGSYT